MPELPEVETVRRHLERRILNRRVARVEVSGLALRKPLTARFASSFKGGHFTAARRVGKFLLLDWESSSGTRNRTLMAHLGMTGYFLHHDASPREKPPHTHALWRFDDGSVLLFVDPRRFGLLEWVARESRPPNVGLDPSETPIDPEWLHEQLRKSRAPIKSFLLDQRRLAGIGNIYACEALFRAKISPRRQSRTLSREEAGRLAVAIAESLGEAVEHRGTTFSDFRDLDDRPGEYAVALHVYGREDEACRRCATPIRRITQSGRSTFYCTRCQRREPRPSWARRR